MCGQGVLNIEGLSLKGYSVNLPQLEHRVGSVTLPEGAPLLLAEAAAKYDSVRGCTVAGRVDVGWACAGANAGAGACTAAGSGSGDGVGAAGADAGYGSGGGCAALQKV